VVENSPIPESPLPEYPPATRVFTTDALIFAGTGTWAAEVSSLKAILSTNGASFQSVSSAELNAMSVEQLASFGVLIFPGGYGGQQAASLTATAHAHLREAVQERGVGYVGFCAGAFIAVAPAPQVGQDVSYGLGVADGAVMDYYYLENQGVTAQMTIQTFADGSTRDILWYGGPVTPGGSGQVVARYPNGDPSISQLESGAGLVIVSGGHPAAPTSSKSGLGLSDSDGTDFDITWTLIRAAMLHEPVVAE
jgi:glutamine amidotransferase-like uncharacterized protein